MCQLRGTLQITSAYPTGRGRFFLGFISRGLLRDDGISFRFPLLVSRSKEYSIQVQEWRFCSQPSCADIKNSIQSNITAQSLGVAQKKERTMKMKCAECKAEWEDHVAFCPHCSGVDIFVVLEPLENESDDRLTEQRSNKSVV